MARVVHFEIQADDPDRARTFYSEALGWTFEDYSDAMGGAPYWGVITGPAEQPGINGGLLGRPAATPGQHQGTNAYVCTVQVDDYDATHERIIAAGGTVAMEKFPIPRMAWQGYYLDTEGNTFGVHQADPDAG